MYPPPMWMPPPPPPPRQKPAPPDGITEEGFPYFQRGKISIDTGACLNTDGDACGNSLKLKGRIPLVDTLVFEAVVPIGLTRTQASHPAGNPTLGAEYVGRVMKKMWITGGGALGFPLVEDRRQLIDTVPHGRWDFHHYNHEIVPITFVLNWEMHVSIVELRVDLEPSMWFPTGGNDFDGAFQHAFEVQIGHNIGGGLRLQGVFVGSFEEYQFAMQPFLYLSRELGFLRTGPMMPFNEPLGPPFEQSWGFLLEAGIHID